MPSELSVSHPAQCRSTATDADIAIALCILDVQLQPNWHYAADHRGTNDASHLQVPGWAKRLTASTEFILAARRAWDEARAERLGLTLPDPVGTRRFDVTLAPIRAPDGSVHGINVCILDVTRSLLTREAMADTADCYRLAADYTYDWEYWIAPGGRLRWMSPSSARVSGYEPSAFFIDPDLLERIVHPDDRAAVMAHLLRRCSEGEPDTQTFRILRADGEIRWIEQICQAVFESNGDFAGKRASNRDVTDRMQVEQALRESENQFRLMFELATVGMALIDPQTRSILSANQRLCRILGYSADELLGKTFYELTHAEDREQDLLSFRRAMQPEQADYFTEKRYVRKDGRIVWGLVNATFIRDETGYPLKAVAAIIDITARRQAEARARELATVVECSSDFIGIADLDERGIYLNPAGKALVGLDSDEAVLAARIEDFIHPEDLPFARQEVLPIIAREGRWSGEIRFRHFRTGEAIDVYWDALRIDDPETGRPLQFATVTRDIRKEKAAELAMRQADQRKDEFLAMLGHELRNPMAPIRNAVEIIRRVGIGDDPRIHWAVEVLDRQTAHMGRLLDDLLDVSRIVKGRLELELRPVSVSDMVQQVADGVQSLMDERHHHFTWTLPGPDVLVEGDSVRLSQILLNLLVNAAKYTPAGGRVRVETETTSDRILIRVIDTGQGMSRKQIDSLFTLFAPGVRPADTQSGGLGLGLAIARRLTEMHGGHLQAISAGVDRGTEMRLQLPRIQTPQPHEETATETDRPIPASAPDLKRILVVDDNADVAGALAMLLELLGYSVETAHSGAAGIAAARRFRPRIAFLDIGIPDMDGLEMAQRLRADFPDPKQLMLVALTGLGHEQARERIAAAGFDRHLVKPAEQRVLMELLEQVD
ncbi:hybrid sensor histidine kinase/response regulator [Imhoffiella purpurea]|uniref:histidine kinase n=1 Tax=Imhoffiella purpurea TaxID=1249627 RepID=W9V6M6_9GAMM|nr:PAS domain S-box protein [Imhoffiella purpurea]EXJ15039.1 Chemotaxis protein methyltransferase CheR [Imhoffiella purpurea]